MRVAIDSGLAEQAPYSVICFDEVDENRRKKVAKIFFGKYLAE